MVEFEFNNPVDTADLTEFFARCGWEEVDAGVKLEWALASSEDWVVCREEGQLVGFGRSYRLNPLKRMVFDVVVDVRFRQGGLKERIIGLLSAGAGRMEDVTVFSAGWSSSPGRGAAGEREVGGPAEIPEAPTGAYLGKQAPFRDEGTE